MKKIAVIPARLNSTRLPKKLLQDLGGKPVIVQTFLAVKKTNLFDEVLVVTDSKEIFSEIEKAEGKAKLSIKDHQSGSDRIAEAVENEDFDLIVNVQGDEPFIDKQSLENLIKVFDNDSLKQIDLASLMISIEDEKEIENPNNVKVVIDNQGFALYFSRSKIPFVRDKEGYFNFKKHIGVYAFRKQALMDFYHLEMGKLESAEKLEQLRYLENGKRIKMVETQSHNIGIDTQEDLDKARIIFQNKECQN